MNPFGPCCVGPENLRSTAKDFYFKFKFFRSVSLLGRVQRSLAKSEPKSLLGANRIKFSYRLVPWGRSQDQPLL